jgi:hypothetical protein
MKPKSCRARVPSSFWEAACVSPVTRGTGACARESNPSRRRSPLPMTRSRRASSPAADGPGGQQPRRRLERTVHTLLAAAQREREAKLDAGRVDTVFKVGDQVLLRTKELLDAADIGKLRPRWDGPLTVRACPSPDTCTLALPRKMRCSMAVYVDGGPAQAFARAGRRPSGSGPDIGLGARGGAAAHPQGDPRGPALARAVARPHFGGRRVAAGEGVGSLPGAGGRERRGHPAPQAHPPECRRAGSPPGGFGDGPPGSPGRIPDCSGCAGGAVHPVALANAGLGPGNGGQGPESPGRAASHGPGGRRGALGVGEAAASLFGATSRGSGPAGWWVLLCRPGRRLDQSLIGRRPAGPA